MSTASHIHEQMALVPKSPIRHFQTISPFKGTDKFGPSHDFGSRACTGGFGSCSYWHRWWIGITQSYWHPCNSHETIPCKKRTRLKGEALIGSERRFTRPVHWFQFSVSVLARYDLWGLDECQQDYVVVYASWSQSDQLRSNESRISEAITARTAQGIWGVSMGHVIAIASLIPIKED